jgi:hypothetical protein
VTVSGDAQRSAICSTSIARHWLRPEVPSFDRDELWTRYRQAVTYAFVSPLTTAGLGGMQTDGIALEGLQRAVARRRRPGNGCRSAAGDVKVGGWTFHG